MVGCIVFGSCITHETPSSVALVAVFGPAALALTGPERGLCSQLEPPRVDIPLGRKKFGVFDHKAHSTSEKYES